MAAYINRTVSMMSGDSPRQSVIPPSNQRYYKDSSPLQIFVKAKRKINDIFSEVDGYVHDSVAHLESIRKNDALTENLHIEKIFEYVGKIQGIRDVLSRDHMKVAFFGRTSNGKSTVINAMLKDKILPSGIGHTTNCFLQVEGSENGEAYLVTADSNQKKNVKSIGQLAHALCEQKLKESELVHIFWPKNKCTLLRDDVVFVDSPGIDVTPNVDDWIDKYCLDADVFVLVANSESTLMITEKAFFHKVSTRLSKPNIFILNNRWDASVTETEYLEQVRMQHMERAVDFLVNELKVCNTKEAEKRVFFISAKEVLQARAKEQEGLPLQAGALAEGFPARYFEFQNFEQTFEECISKSAVKTKFEQHSQRGKLLIQEIRATMDSLYERSQQLKAEKSFHKKDLNDKLNFTEQRLLILTQQMKEKIQNVVMETEEKVKKALSEEIRRLSILIEEFHAPFHSDSFVLSVYKRELHTHVESGLGSNLKARLSSVLALNIEDSQREMTEQMTALLPFEKKQKTFGNFTRRQPFEIFYRLNCDNLCADFKEDLEFRFSWGVSSIISRIFNVNNKRRQIPLKNYYSNQIIQSPTTLNEQWSFDDRRTSSAVTSDDRNSSLSDTWLAALTSKAALSSIGSQGTIGGLFVSGFMLKTIGWRIIIVTGTFYGLLYLYEWMTWTNSAKERAFKQQYVQHATKKLRLIVDLTSANCSHQVQQELSTTFAQLCQLIDESNDEMAEQMNQLDKEVQNLESACIRSKVLRNKADYLMKELEMFNETYLKMYT